MRTHTEHFETVVVGAGQAGLSVGYHLARRDRPFLILNEQARVGDHWRANWDTLQLYTPAGYDALPGMRFPADRWTFPTKDQMGDYLEAYARRFDLPVRSGTRVQRLVADGEGGYLVMTSAGPVHADKVVVATGTFGHTPYVPDLAADLDPRILQLHSSQYRRPAQLRPGPVLVVGASHSGADIAFEVAPGTGRCCPGASRGSFPCGSRAVPPIWPSRPCSSSPGTC